MLKARKFYLFLCLLLAFAPCRGAWAQAVVTEDTYLARHTEVDGQCLFELDGFTLDVYRADFARDQSAMVLDVYPTGDWSQSIVPQVKLDGQAVDLTCQVELIQGAQPVYAYTFTGPGTKALPKALTLVFPQAAVQVALRRQVYDFDQPAYYLEHEVAAAPSAYQALSQAQDLAAAARALLPSGAALVDCYLEEDRAGVEYTLKDTHCLVDYFADGHVEKYQIWDGDWNIVQASSQRDDVQFTNIAMRQGMGRFSLLRPRGAPLSGSVRRDGLSFRVEAYHIKDGRLMVDWTAGADRPLYLQVGNLFLGGQSLDGYNRNIQGQLDSLVPLVENDGRYTYEGASIVDLDELPVASKDMSLTLYFVEAAAPIADWEKGPFGDGAMLLDTGGEYSMIDHIDGEGATGSGALSGQFDLIWRDEPAYVAACEQLGFTRLVDALTLSFTVEDLPLTQ